MEERLVNTLIEDFGVAVTSVDFEASGLYNRLPPYLFEIYKFYGVALDGLPCIFAEPLGDTPAIQDILKHFLRIRQEKNVPLVLKLKWISSYRRKSLIEAKIPFAADGQVYLPFYGIAFRERLYNGEIANCEKLMPSSQLLLLYYLYQSENAIRTVGLAEKLGLSAMQITRAVRQLEKMRLFEVHKDGVQIVISGTLNRRALFESAEPVMLNPVKAIKFVKISDLPGQLPVSGETAIDQYSMLAGPQVPINAYHGKLTDLKGTSSLIDRNEQVCVEIWRYSPLIFSERKDVADPLSVILSLRHIHDGRVDEAIQQIYENLWGV
jgi:DNA-binding MarR family transcriptional regulator